VEQGDFGDQYKTGMSSRGAGALRDFGPPMLVQGYSHHCWPGPRCLLIPRQRRNSRHPATALGANSGLMRRKNANKLLPLHSITSSARASTVEGISRPRAFAALRLTTSTYLVGA
jgi:hypothetical protein